MHGRSFLVNIALLPKLDARGLMPGTTIPQLTLTRTPSSFNVRPLNLPQSDISLIDAKMEYTSKPPKQKKRSKGAAAATRHGCQSSHCLEDLGHCERLDCQQLVAQETQSLEFRKIALGLSLDSRIEESQRLYAEIQEECDLTEFDSGSMRSSLLAYHVGMKEMEQSIACKCPSCTLKQSRTVYEHDANKFAVVKDWVDALREYRSEYDFEAMLIQENKSTSYEASPSAPCLAPN